MSESIIIALITTAGTIIGALIGAYARKPSKPESTPTAIQSLPEGRRWNWASILTGAVIGAVTVLLFFFIISISELFQDDLYDGFNKAGYDGKVNSSIWLPAVTSPNSIEQGDGVMTFHIEPGFGEVISLYSKKKVTTDQNNYAEAQILLSSKTPKGAYADTGFALATTEHASGKEYVNLCVIGRSSTGAQVWCEVYGRKDEAEYSTEKTYTDYDVWHTVRIEMTRGLVTTFYIDGEQVGQYQPSDANEFIGNQFVVRLEVFTLGQEGITAQFDDVKLGELK